MEDFWEKLLHGHSQGTSRNAVDHGMALGEDFESVRALTESGRAAKALPLPVKAGTKVSFAGNLGALLTYDAPPMDGAIGEVVSVRSANGDVTDHEGMVFVKWADGQLRSVHAEHLRLSPVDGKGKKARVVLGDPTDFLGRVPSHVTSLRVASLGDLTSFLKVSNNTLVHKSTKDLWAFNKDADGGIIVERLFDSDGKPLKE